MLEVSRLARMNNVQVVDFDMCRFAHSDEGSRESAHELAAGGTEGEQEMPQPLATSNKGQRHEEPGQRRLGSRALQEKKFAVKTTDEQLDQEKAAAACREEIKYFLAMGLLEGTLRTRKRKNWTTTHGHQVGRRQEGRRTVQQRNR